MRIKIRYIAAGLFGFLFFTGVNSFVEGASMSGKDRTSVETETAGGCTVEKFSVYSKSMDRDIRAIVILPPEYKSNSGKKYPILYTLHGRGAPYGVYNDMGQIKSALKDKPMIVTCMDADYGSWYLDSLNPQYADSKKKGPKVKSLFTTFFLDEFIPCIDKYYRVNPQQRMVTGFSMGGFGALHYILAKPEMFVSVSSLSGAFYALADAKGRERVGSLLGSYSENKEKYEEQDLFMAVKKYAANKTKLPPVYLHCGTEDELMSTNVEMNDLLQKSGYTSSLKKSSGKHDFKFWAGAVPGFMDFHWKTVNK